MLTFQERDVYRCSCSIEFARGSAMECAVVLDVVRRPGVGTDEPHRHAVELLGRMASVVSKLSR